jgi:type III restriction enzyme
MCSGQVRIATEQKGRACTQYSHRHNRWSPWKHRYGFDSAWEASEDFHLDNSPNVTAWAKNDHLGFEILYIYRGVVRKYRPDFIIRLKSGDMLVLETKGQDSEQNRSKRRFLGEWVNAVNEHGGFGRWHADVSWDPGDIHDILENYAPMPT